jgi:copper transport protein
MAGTMHMDHELIAFNAALALGFGLAVWQPGKARGMLPVTGIIAAGLVVAAAVDIADGTVGLLHEVQHLLLVLGTLLLWALARVEGAPERPTADQLDTPEHTRLADVPDEPVAERRLRSVRPHPPAARHIPGKVAALVLLGTVVGVLASGQRPASAHAVLEQTSPADGSTVRTAPDQISLQFGEPVTVESGSIRVFDDRLHPVQSGGATGSGSPRVGIGLRSGLHTGTYTVTWRVVSADSHPVSGGFTFSIGHPSTVTGTVQAADGGSRLVGILLGAARFAAYAGVVLGLGTAAVLFAFWPVGRFEDRPRRLLWIGWGLLLAGTLVGLLLEGPYGAGRSIAHAFDGSLLADTFGARYGQVLGTRVALLTLLAGFLAEALRTPRVARWVLGGFGTLSVGVLVTFALAGHADTGNQAPLTSLSDVLHLASMGVWLGGLALIVGCLAGRATELRRVLPRFSRLAFTAVTVLVGTGIYQTWRDVGSWAGFTDTVYGRLLLAKIGCVVLLLGLGNLARRWVARQYGSVSRPAVVREPVAAGGPPPPLPPESPPSEPGPAIPGPGDGELRTLRRGLAAEVVLGVSVLILTTILVNTAQAKETQSQAGSASYSASYSTTDTSGQTRVRLTVTPDRTGPVKLVLRVQRPTGAVLPVQKVTASLSLPAENIGPLPVTFAGVGKGPMTARTALARPGNWDLDVTVQTSPIEATAFRLAIPVP